MKDNNKTLSSLALKQGQQQCEEFSWVLFQEGI